MSFEKQVRAHKQVLENLLTECKSTLEQPPNVVAQNKIVVLTAIIEKATMMCDEALRAAQLPTPEVEAILEQYSVRSAQYGTNPVLDEIDAMRSEIERLSRAVDILQAMRKRRELSHRLVGFDPRLMGPWARWIRTLEQYKINQNLSDKDRKGLLSEIDNWRSILAQEI
ncbi:MAG: hypothetical protein ACFFCO_12345 [Promethearchaeota archaeon]